VGRRRLWSSKLSFGLRADLGTLPARRLAGIAIDMQPADPAAFEGFSAELERVRGREAFELTQRVHFCRAGVRTLFVAASDAGEPIYAQWLVRPDEQRALHRAARRLFPELHDGEALVEGAYTFVAYRRLGAMADGMHQLLARAREAGDRSVLTYVDADNVASLRGCAHVGFVADHVRKNLWCLGRRFVRRRPLDESAEARWSAAVG
jgi:hypothetical protein